MDLFLLLTTIILLSILQGKAAENSILNPKDPSHRINHLKNLKHLQEVLKLKLNASATVSNESESLNIPQSSWGSSSDMCTIIREIIKVIIDCLSKITAQNRGYVPSGIYIASSTVPVPLDQLKILTDLEKIKNYVSEFPDCLSLVNSLEFDVRKAIEKLNSSSIEEILMIFKYQVEKKVPKHPQTHGSSRYSEFQALICLGLVENEDKTQFESCLSVLSILHRCISSKLQNSSSHVDESLLKDSGKLIQGIQRLETDCGTFYTAEGVRIVCSEEEISDGTSWKSRNLSEKFNNRNTSVLDTFEDFSNLIKVSEKLRGKKARADPTVDMEIGQLIHEFDQTLFDFGFKLLKHFLKYLSIVFRPSKPKINDLRIFLDSLKFVKQLSEGVTYSNQRFAQVLSPLSNFLWFKQVLERRNNSSMKYLARRKHFRKSSEIFKLSQTFLLTTVLYKCFVVLAGLAAQAQSENKFNWHKTDADTDGISIFDDYLS